MPAPSDAHYTTVITAIADGEVVPFLGAGVNQCGRPEGKGYRRGKYLPSGSELAEILAKHFRYSGDDPKDLLRVSQYVALMRGSAALYRRLHHVFAVDYDFTPVHLFLARLPAVLSKKGYPPYQLIVTTNYDDVLERAFEAADEPFDLVWYVAEGKRRGQFLHKPPDGEVRLIEKPNEDQDLPIEALGVPARMKRTVILKIHGAVDRVSVPESSFVITEDHYIDYLARKDISNLMPAKLMAKLRHSNYLFLGYSLRDWNLRVILYRIWAEQELSYKSWAIQKEPKPLEQRFWIKHDVEIIEQCLEDYVPALKEKMQALPPAEVEYERDDILCQALQGPDALL